MICLQRIVAAWESAQVEPHDQYSLQRLQGLSTHMKSTSTWVNATIFLFTPLPCLVLVTLLDCFELAPPEMGVAAGYRFWIRVFCVASVISVTELTQLQATVPALQLNASKILRMSVFSSTVPVATSIGLAYLIEYPVPFLYPAMAPVWLISTAISFLYSCGDIVRGNAQV